MTIGHGTSGSWSRAAADSLINGGLTSVLDQLDDAPEEEIVALKIFTRPVRKETFDRISRIEDVPKADRVTLLNIEPPHHGPLRRGSNG